MESERFDALVRGTYEGTTRRGVVGVGVGALAASALGLIGLRSEVDAKKKKKKKRCKGDRPVKCGKGCCPEAYSQCCDDAFQASNSFTCNPPDFTCCPLDQGGGSCPSDEPQCCPATTQDPYGSCAEADATCCTSEEGGGSCPADTVCCSNLFLSCCPGAADCCEIDDDCDVDAECIDGCCEALVARSAARSGRSTKRAGVSRFYKKAK